MLPEVVLKDVSRDDVDRIAWWLEGEEISARWFGHYGCGDPVHRGYDPAHMIEASEWEWRRVFDDPHRPILSIYDETDQHIGECQVIFDPNGGAELSLLIGRRALWHHGYGTATVMTLLDRTFGEYALNRAWVSVPEDNLAALGLFGKLGFVLETTRELCRTSDGGPLSTRIMAIDSVTYKARQVAAEHPVATRRVVTVTGLPGSGSEAVAQEVARMLGTRLVGEEVRDRLCQRLRCSPADLEWFETTTRSFWGRLLGAIVLPTDWSAFFDLRYQWHRPDYHADYDAFDNQITKKDYVECLDAVVRSLAAEGSVVMHGQGSHLFVRPADGTLSVFVSASPQARRLRIAREQGLETEAAEQQLEQLDQDEISMCKHLLGADLTDMGQYDLTLNLERLSPSAAAQLVVGALRTATPSAPAARPTAASVPEPTA